MYLINITCTHSSSSSLNGGHIQNYYSYPTCKDVSAAIQLTILET